MEGVVLKGREERRRRWQEYVEGQRQSGLSVTAYCATNNLKPYQFWYWRRVLSANRAPEGGGFVEVAGGRADGAFLAVRVRDVEILVAEGFNPILLRRVVESLSSP